jgi:hypothetical protein
LSHINHITLEALLVHMYVAKAKIFSNPDFTQFSLNQGTSLESWSEAMARRFRLCDFDQATMTMKEKFGAPFFSELKAVLGKLRSKDLNSSEISNFEYLDLYKEPLFLDSA